MEVKVKRAPRRVYPVRLSEEEVGALERLAAETEVAPSALARRFIQDGLRKAGRG